MIATTTTAAAAYPAYTGGAGGYAGWNTTTTLTTATAVTATPTALVGAKEKVASKGCSKKRQSRIKRHSDGNSKAQARKAAMLPPRM